MPWRKRSFQKTRASCFAAAMRAASSESSKQPAENGRRMTSERQIPSSQVTIATSGLGFAKGRGMATRGACTVSSDDRMSCRSWTSCRRSICCRAKWAKSWKASSTEHSTSPRRLRSRRVRPTSRRSASAQSSRPGRRALTAALWAPGASATFALPLSLLRRHQCHVQRDGAAPAPAFCWFLASWLSHSTARKISTTLSAPLGSMSRRRACDHSGPKVSTSCASSSSSEWRGVVRPEFKGGERLAPPASWSRSMATRRPKGPACSARSGLRTATHRANRVARGTSLRSREITEDESQPSQALSSPARATKSTQRSLSPSWHAPDLPVSRRRAHRRAAACPSRAKHPGRAAATAASVAKWPPARVAAFAATCRPASARRKSDSGGPSPREPDGASARQSMERKLRNGV
mmetsp:Transcript_57157/g.127503  ORF Transcript_57157/g.127503 Transcript_57157/m.127503 type:complete len:407 (-) Transcript_57157:19-1239(-)